MLQPNEEDSPQSPEPSNPSPSTTPPMNVRTIEGKETLHTITDDATFYCEDEPRRVYWDFSSNDTFDSNKPRPVSSFRAPPPYRGLQNDKKKAEHGMYFAQKERLSQHTCEACGQPLPIRKAPQCSEQTQNTNIIIQPLKYFITVLHVY